MKMLWLLGGLGVGGGLVYLLDPEKGAGRRDDVRGQLSAYGRQTEDFLDNSTRTLGRQAQAVLARTRRPFRRQPGLGERLLAKAAQCGMPTGLVLLGCIGLGAGLVALLEPQGGPRRRARLRDKARAYWRPTEPRHAPQEALRRPWRFFQGHATRQVDAHTRRPAQGEAWYAEPAGYDSPVLYSEPFLTRDEAVTWAKAQEARRPWRFFQGHATRQVDAHTRRPAQGEAWYAEPTDYDSPVLYSEPFLTRDEAENWANAQEKKQVG